MEKKYNIVMEQAKNANADHESLKIINVFRTKILESLDLYYKADIAERSAAGRKVESKEWSISRRKGAALEKRFRQAVSEITEIPRAQAAAARIWKEKFGLA